MGLIMGMALVYGSHGSRGMVVMVGSLPQEWHFL